MALIRKSKRRKHRKPVVHHKRKRHHKKKHKKKKVLVKPKPGITTPAAPAPTPTAATLPITVGAPASDPGDLPPPVVQPDPDPLVYSGSFGRAQAERLMWRAGFGPAKAGFGPAAFQSPDALAAMGLQAAVQSLTRPSGARQLVGPDPYYVSNSLHVAITRDSASSSSNHDHVWWLDQMVRSDQPLVERMTLIWHDWFANSNIDIEQQALMIDQNDFFRANALGSFRTMLRGDGTDPAVRGGITTDPAMLVYLSGISNRKGAPNENYGREVMELFTLGAERNAYSEDDVREMARAFTGWQADGGSTNFSNFRYTPSRHDGTLPRSAGYVPKAIFGQTEPANTDWTWLDACDLAINHALHPSFFVLKMWSYFIPGLPSAATQAALEQRYVSSGYSIRDVVETILMLPDFYTGGPMVKPPVVYNAGLLRAAGRGIDTLSWTNRGDDMGQRMFYPPNVSGWNDQSWLDTNTLYGRWQTMKDVLVAPYSLPATNSGYDSAETGDQALAAALAFWGDPALTPEARASLQSFANTCPVPAAPAPGATAAVIKAAADARAQRQNALRHLIAHTPDFQTI